MAKRSDGRKYQVGDRVRFRYGIEIPLATVVEYRGLLATGRRPLYRLKVEFDPEPFFTEVPEDRLYPADGQGDAAPAEKP
jgi:hypothetical protein